MQGTWHNNRPLPTSSRRPELQLICQVSDIAPAKLEIEDPRWTASTGPRRLRLDGAWGLRAPPTLGVSWATSRHLTGCTPCRPFFSRLRCLEQSPLRARRGHPTRENAHPHLLRAAASAGVASPLKDPARHLGASGSAEALNAGLCRRLGLRLQVQLFRGLRPADRARDTNTCHGSHTGRTAARLFCGPV